MGSKFYADSHTLPRKVLYLVAAPSTPDGVREEAIERVDVPHAVEDLRGPAGSWPTPPPVLAREMSTGFLPDASRAKRKNVSRR